MLEGRKKYKKDNGDNEVIPDIFFVTVIILQCVQKNMYPLKKCTFVPQ